MATATHVGPILVSGLGIQGPATTQTALPSTLLLVNNAGTGYITGCGPSPGVNGEIIFRVCDSAGANVLNVLGLEGSGDGIFYNNLTVQGILTALTKLDVDGDAQFNANVGVTGALEAQRGDYTSLFVQGSRVLTEAELPPDAIPYPPPGVSVSTGTAWSPSINPADLPRLSTPNTFTAAQTINSVFHADKNVAGTVPPPASGSGLQIVWNVGNGSGETDFINYNGGAGGGFHWYNVAPGTTVTNSTATVMSLDAGNAAFNGNVTVASGTVSIGALGGSPGVATNGNFILEAGGAGTIFVNYNSGTGGVNFCNGAQNVVAHIDSVGNANFNGALTVAGGANLNGGVNASLYRLTSITPSATWQADSVTTFIDCGGTGRLLLNYFNNPGGIGFGNDGAGTPVVIFDPSGNASFHGTLSAGNATGTNLLHGTQLYMTTLTAGRVVSMLVGEDPSTGANWGGGRLTFTPNTGNGNLGVLSMDASKTSVGFSDIHIGTGGSAVNISATGLPTQILGALSVFGAKTFVVPHPLIEGKDLYHACLEGPENGVFYRGEVTTKKGTAEVTLPDYFEALTFKEDRSVLLTQKIHPGDSVLAMLAATPISKGKFIIVSSVPATIVAWEVKAVRRISVDRLAVVRDKFVHPTKGIA